MAAAVADAHRHQWGYVLAATVRVTGDLDVAEECVQDAYARALVSWTENGVPAKPGGWLTTVAKRRAIDLLRRDTTLRRALPLLLEPDTSEFAPTEPEMRAVEDDRLRLIFTCCHPALAEQAQVALTLRLLCGLSTSEVAHAFLVSEATMAARITRAKKKISLAGIPYRVPPAAELAERTTAVLDVVHLMFTTGHTAPAGSSLLRLDLVDRSIDLARMLHLLLPEDHDVTGLLALILLTDSRRATRMDANGGLVLLSAQNRTLWDTGQIGEGTALVREALRGGRAPRRFALMAAIAAVHAEAPNWATTDWAEVRGLYDVLLAAWPSPVVALNRAVAIGFHEGPQAGLTAVDSLSAEPRLATYGYLAAARADFLRQLGRVVEARTAYSEALLLTENEVERSFLAARLSALD